MSSSIFFKFKSQKDSQRVTFDGPGISVFEVKREIISISQLGDGTDFDLVIYNEDSNEEYDDDTTVIPRSTSIVARRLPARIRGAGRAARYVSGKMPVTAKNQHRKEAQHGRNAPDGHGTSVTIGGTDTDNAQTEEEKIAAMFAADASSWKQQQEQMANAKPVYRGAGRGKPVNIPDRPPPPGYICYRCQEKGHWIQACPTNDDPEFDKKPRLRRTTGIPKSFQQTVAKPVAGPVNDGLTDDTKQNSNVMINAEGEFVIALPDQKTFEKFQEKAKAATQKQQEAAADKEVQERGLECSIDKRMFVEPMKTPCCGKTYCNECIENALINNDFVCPNCETEGVLMENLVPDDETAKKIRVFEDEKTAARKEKERSKSPTKTDTKAEDAAAPKVPDAIASPKAGSKSPKSQSGSRPQSSEGKEKTPQPTSTNPRKRPAEEELENDRVPTAPAAMRDVSSTPSSSTPQPPSAPKNQQEFIAQMNAMSAQLGNTDGASNNNMPNNNMPNNMMPFPMPNMPNMPNMNGMNGMMNPMMMAMSMPGMMGMNPMNPMMMMPGFNNMPNMPNLPNMPNNNFPQPNFPNNNGGSGMGNFPQQNGYNQNNWNNRNGNWTPQQQSQQNGMGRGMSGPQFANQQRQGGDEDAYFRKPVNPHRHQARQKRVRPSDYTELGQ